MTRIYQPVAIQTDLRSQHNPEDILNYIVDHAYYMIKNNISSRYIIDILDGLRDSGIIEYIGFGSNRRFFKIKADMRSLINSLGFSNSNIDVICGIPFNVFGGTKDNFREFYATEFIRKLAVQTGETDAVFLASVLPEAKIYDSEGIIILQEMVVPIESSDLVLSELEKNIDNFVSTDNNDHDVVRTHIGNAVLSLLWNNDNLKKQYINIMNAMDKYFVFADLNIFYSRFNFGFKRTNQGWYLTVLDLGTVLPKISGAMIPVCSHCGHELHYVHFGDKYIFDGTERERRTVAALQQSGLYRCTNPNCDTIKNHGIEFNIMDMQVFEMYKLSLMDYIYSNPQNVRDTTMYKIL